MSAWIARTDRRAAFPDGRTRGSASRGREIAKCAMAVTVGLVLGVTVAEAAVRVFALTGTEAGQRIAARDPFEFLYEPFGNHGYRQRPGKVERYKNRTRAVFNSMGYRGPVVSVEKPAGTYRIVLLGGSTTFGYGVNDDETIDAHMRRLLPARFPGACFEVVNLALGGYDSYQDYERMRVDGTRLAPDLVIVNSGINDVRNALYPRLAAPPDPRTLIWEPVMQTMREEAEHGLRLSTVVQHYSYLARIPGYALEVWGQRQGLNTIRVTEPDPSAIDYFATNLERTAELGFSRGAAVILSAPPSALTRANRPSDPPEKSYRVRDAGTTEKYRQWLAARMREVAEQQRAAGRRVTYVSHDLPLEEFLDDAHLTGAGNLTVARGLTNVAEPFIRSALRAAPADPPTCRGAQATAPVLRRGKV
jgi:GDSL-like Lipase/Acylhydrolase family